MTEIVRRLLDREANYTTIPNEFLRDPRISNGARGLLAQIMSHRAGWRLTLATLQNATQEGRTAVQTQIKQLEDAGYLIRQRLRNSDGTVKGMLYELTDPFVDDDSTENNKDGKTNSGEPSCRSATSRSTTYGQSATKKKPIEEETYLEEDSLVVADASDEKIGASEPSQTLDLPGLTDASMEVRAIERLNDLVVANGFSRPGAQKRNADAARLLFRDHDPHEIRAVMDWALSDEFWRTNIRSMSSFRAKYEALRAKMQLAANAPNRSRNRAQERIDDHVAVVRSLAARNASREAIL